MDFLDLASRYRPQRFEDVVGQRYPVQYLSALIKQRLRGQNLLMYGSVGSGKTSLVRLYAKALNCKSPNDSGSPCGSCSSCMDVSRGWCSEYDVSGQGGSLPAVLAWTKDHNRRHHVYPNRVLFYDEAHSLDEHAADALLKAVEEPKQGICFCFATTEKGLMRRALQSRLTPLEVKPLSIHDSVKLMSRVADQEQIRYQVSALKVIAGLKDGYPRDLLNGLAQVCGPEKALVSLENVRNHFDTSHIEYLISYFTALAKGADNEQIQIFSEWQEPGFRKIAWIQAFLTSLYFRDILARDIVVDALMDSITDGERAPVIEQFCLRLSVASRRDLEPYWRRLMGFWSTPASTPSDLDVLLRLALFHHLVNVELPRQTRAKGHDGSSDHIDVMPHISKDKVSLDATVDVVDQKHEFLNVNDVRTIINSASFLVQAHGRWFNARFDVKLVTGKIRTQERAVSLILQFYDELERKVGEWGKGHLLAGLTVLERHPGFLHGLILTHLPRISPDDDEQVDCLVEAESWYRAWAHERTMQSYDETVTFKTEPKGGSDGWAFHWDQTLDLCATLDSTLTCFDPQHGCDRPLRELLSMSSKSRHSGPISFEIVTRRGLASPEAVASSELFGMHLLSAFDDQAWDWVKKRWELAEFHSRVKERKRRQNDLAELELEHGSGNPQAHRERQQLENSWFQRGEDRRRSRPWRLQKAV